MDGKPALGYLPFLRLDVPVAQVSPHQLEAGIPGLASGHGDLVEALELPGSGACRGRVG